MKVGKEDLSWPGGLKTTAGGKRTKIELRRPWQVPMTTAATCPLCEEYENGGSLIETPEGWKVVHNIASNHDPHYLSISRQCWPEEVLRTLGGKEKIAEAMAIATTVIAEKESGKPNIFLSINLGHGAGQTKRHIHYHIFKVDRPTTNTGKEFAVIQKKHPELIILKNKDFTVSAGGLRAGQLIILPKSQTKPFRELATPLAEVVDEIVTLCSEKFKDPEGLPPDYGLGFSFSHGKLRWGSAVFLLNNWGAYENLAPFMGLPINLRWPHRVTAEYLKQK